MTRVDERASDIALERARRAHGDAHPANERERSLPRVAHSRSLPRVTSGRGERAREWTRTTSRTSRTSRTSAKSQPLSRAVGARRSRAMRVVRVFVPLTLLEEKSARFTPSARSSERSREDETSCSDSNDGTARMTIVGTARGRDDWTDVVAFRAGRFTRDEDEEGDLAIVGEISFDSEYDNDVNDARNRAIEMMRRHEVEVWVTLRLTSGNAPRADAFVASGKGRIEQATVSMVLCPMPNPPLTVMQLEGGSRCAFDVVLEDLNRAGRMANGFRNKCSTRCVMPKETHGFAMSIVRAIDVVLRGLEYKFIKSLGTQTRWGGGFVKRSVCEVFAAPCILRARLRLIRSLLMDTSLNWRELDLLNRRRRVACAVQIAVDIIVGLTLTRACEAFDVQTYIRGFVVGGWGAQPGSKDLLGSRIVEANARWISKGSPLGVKLHVPLARFLGSAALSFLSSLSFSLNASEVVSFHVSFVTFLLRRGGVLGASMMFAIAADTMTIFTIHLSALHVYSSLFITAQIRCIVLVYRRFINPKPPPRGFEKASATRPRTVDEVVSGTLLLPPLVLLFPTVFFYYVSYLVFHACTVLARLVLVFIASMLLTFPIDDFIVRVWTPHAFPKSVRMYTRNVRGVDMVAIAPTSHSLGDIMRPFNGCVGAWLSTIGATVARACITCGRFPVTLVPWEFEREIAS